MGIASLITAGLLSGFVSCKKENGTSELRADMVDFVNATKKAYIDHDRYSCFVLNEKIRVNNRTGRIVALERGDRLCTIEGVPQATNYNAFYPADLLTDADANLNLSTGLNGKSVTLPDTQRYEKDARGYQIISNPMMAVLTGASESNHILHFRNLCALLRLTVRTTDAFDAVRVRIQDRKLSGTGTIVFDSNRIVMDGTGCADSVELRLPSGHVGTPVGETFYIVIPEISKGDENKNHDVVVSFLKNGSIIKKFKRTIHTSDLELKASQIHTLGFFTFNTAQFSVSDTKKVVFSPGNLQWSDRAMAQWHPTASTNIYDCIDGTWRFAEHQYDYIGSGNTFERRDTGWIDLFGWGTSGYNNTKPYSIVFCPSNVTSLTGANANYDWGQFNTIYNPRTRNYDPFGTWRTLTDEEWWYLYSNRRLKGWWSFAAVTITVGNDTVNCMVVFPDSVKAKPAGVSSNLDVNTTNFQRITMADYNALEAAGCVFLPLAGYYDNKGKTYHELSIYNAPIAYYWTASSVTRNPYYFLVQVQTQWNGYINPLPRSSHEYGMSVRLVRDVD